LSKDKGIPQRLVLFDGECILCNRSVAWLLKIDKKEVLTFATLQYAKENHLVKDLEAQPDSIIYLQNARLLNRTSALIAIMKDIGGICRMAALLQIIPSFFRNYVYYLIAKHRFKIWGKTEQCLFLNSKLRHRFLGV
jgi:predicted DCC family thiol-disulfide oxidoreductase YuxK